MNSMNLLAEMLSSRTRAELFRLLFGVTIKPLHLREIERITGLSTGSIRQETAKLQKLGLITSRKDGNRICFEANTKHPIYEEIRRMVLKTVGLVDVLRAALEGNGIQTAFVFGSIAQGTAKAESDVDLMIIGNVGLRKVSSLLSGVGNQLGREINPHVMSSSEFGQRMRRKEHFVSTVMESPKIFVVGSEDDFEAMGK